MSFWDELRRSTEARIGLGRSGSGVPTQALLEFRWAHAQARDAVHSELDLSALPAYELAVRSKAQSREQYLLRPDLGRQLASESADRLAGRTAESVVVLADGLSATALERHAAPMLAALKAYPGGWLVVAARYARVALGDAIGERLRAVVVAVLIGERPGLSAPDSLGIYLTYQPQVGRTDAERNCISNIRKGGLGYDEAAHKLNFLVTEARRLGLSGVGLKESAGRFLA